MASGDLVVTELRRAQRTGEVSWIELYNAGSAVDLEGVRLRLRRLDGGAEQSLMVRRALPLAAGAYVVLAQAPDEELPGYAAYGFAAEAPAAFYPEAAVDVESCGELIDRMIYAPWPAASTYSLGAAPPDAQRNDTSAAWCADSEQTAMEPGTPGEVNRPCR